MKPSILALISASLCLAGSALADTMVDNFQDNNYVSENWGNATWQGADTSTVVGAGAGLRSTKDSGSFLSSPISGSNKDAYTTDTGSGNIAYQYGKTGGSNSAQAASTAPNNKFHSISLALQRSSNGSLSTTNYVRFTAYRLTAAPTSAIFGLALAQNPALFSFPKTSVGPWNAAGTSFDGITLSTTPQVFVVAIKNATMFKADPMYQALTGVGGVDNYAQIRAIQLGWRRSGAPAGSVIDGKFAIDDLMLLDAFPGATVTSPTLAVIEDGSNAPTFTVKLNAMPSHDVTLTPTSTLAGVDFSPSTLTFTTTNWATAQTVTMQASAALNNAFRQGDSPFLVNFTPATSDLWYSSYSYPPAAATLQDDEPVPTASFATTSYSALESDDAVTLSLTLSNPTIQTVTLGLAADGDAVAGTDYALSSNSATFLPGQLTSSVVLYPIDNGDYSAGATRSASIRITSATNATAAAGATSATVVTIADDDPMPTVSFATTSASATEGDADFDAVVQLSGPSTLPVTVDVAYQPSESTADNPADFTFAPSTVSFGPLETTAPLTLSIVNDAFNESPELGTLRLQSPSNATIDSTPGASDLLLTIISDEVPVALSRFDID